MRYKDENKQEAIINATVKLVNEIGFVASSVSKIAKEANVSPATIYIYYKNKEDLLVSTYIRIKQKMGEAVLKNFDESMPIRDIAKNIWFSMFDFIDKNREYFQFTEQFSYSPYSDLVDMDEVEKIFRPVIEILLKGIEQKIIKNVNHDILVAFIFYPIMTLSNARLCSGFNKNDSNIETAFNLAWDAIKL
jgi:AcrR family transcriptional regulator